MKPQQVSPYLRETLSDPKNPDGSPRDNNLVTPYDTGDSLGFYDIFEGDYEVSGEEYDDTLESLGLSETNVGVYKDHNLAT